MAVPEPSAFGWGYGVFDLEREMRDIFQRHLDEAAERVPDDVAVTTELLAAGPVSKLLDQAAKHVDLLCVGPRGYGPVRRVLLGSVSAHIVKQAPCAVLVQVRVARVRGSGHSARRHGHRALARPRAGR